MRGVLYVMTSNEDRKTPSRSVMWTVESHQYECRVYLNFRSEGHVERGGAERWLLAGGAPRSPNSLPGLVRHPERGVQRTDLLQGGAAEDESAPLRLRECWEAPVLSS